MKCKLIYDNRKQTVVPTTGRGAGGVVGWGGQRKRQIAKGHEYSLRGYANTLLLNGSGGLLGETTVRTH